jgi:hypothetical protein
MTFCAQSDGRTLAPALSLEGRGSLIPSPLQGEG